MYGRHIMKRAVQEDSSGSKTLLSGSSTPVVVGICVGSAAFVILVVVSVCLVLRRRSARRSQRGRRSPLKQFLLPKDVKPVIGFKTAAGPGGLKKSPSPVQSPENPDRSADWSSSMTRPSSAGSGGPQQQYHSNTPRTSNAGLYKPNETQPLLESVENGNDHGTIQSQESRVIDEQQEQMIPYNDQQHPKTRGKLNFTLRYNFEKNALTVNIVGASNLPPKPRQSTPTAASTTGAAIMANSTDENFNSTGGVSLLDPYVKLQLLPEKQHKVKTRVVRNTLSPNYDEEFTFYGLNFNQLQSTTLHFAVIAFDRYSRDEIIGEVICPLHTVDLCDSDKQADLSMDLVSRTLKFQNSQHRGELLVSLCFQPATSKLTAVVLKAKNLPKFDITGLADPYVKAYMLYNGQKIAKKKTHVKKRTLTPVYNESFVFDLPSSDPAVLEHISFEFLVMDWDRVTKNEVMGRTDVGLKARSATGRTHWEEVRKNPRKQIAEWHRLRP